MKLIGMNKERVKLVNVLCLPSALVARQISVSEKKKKLYDPVPDHQGYRKAWRFDMCDCLHALSLCGVVLPRAHT